MTDLQKKNLELAEHNFHATADAVIALQAQAKQRLESAEYAQKHLAETSQLLSEANAKLDHARDRFNRAVYDIVPERVHDLVPGYAKNGSSPHRCWA